MYLQNYWHSYYPHLVLILLSNYLLKRYDKMGNIVNILAKYQNISTVNMRMLTC